MTYNAIELKVIAIAVFPIIKAKYDVNNFTLLSGCSCRKWDGKKIT
jgi:hypothetical protein